MRILAIAILLVALPAYAESVPAPTPPVVEQPAAPRPLRDERPERQRQQPSPLAGDFSQFTAGKIAFLRTELKITAEQEPAFAAFVDILKRYSDGMNQHRQTMREQRRDMQNENQLTLATRLGLRIGGMEQDIQALKILQRALAEFYATLTDEQKATAEQLLNHLAR